MLPEQALELERLELLRRKDLRSPLEPEQLGLAWQVLQEQRRRRKDRRQKDQLPVQLVSLEPELQGLALLGQLELASLEQPELLVLPRQMDQHRLALELASEPLLVLHQTSRPLERLGLVWPEQLEQGSQELLVPLRRMDQRPLALELASELVLVLHQTNHRRALALVQEPV